MTPSPPQAVRGRVPAHADKPRRQVELPADWVRRVRGLPGHTIPHIPACVRDAAAEAMADSLEALLEGGADCHLEQGRSKLLLSLPPAGMHLRTELELRHRLWAEGQVEELLVCAEAQATERARASRPSQCGHRARGRKARQLAREQAFRKGVTALTGAMAALTPQEERAWAGKLLPSSAEAEGGAVRRRQPAGTASPRADGSDPASQGGATTDGGPGLAEQQPEEAPHAPTSLRQRALRGCVFPRSSGTGPSGHRPEHLRDALLARKRATTNRLLRAVAKLIETGKAGMLPESAQWLLDSRVAFLSKPDTDTPDLSGWGRSGGGASPRG